MDTTFYDRLAPRYHLLYPDWERGIERQGAALAALLSELGVLPGASVLDVACGIGTQTIGLLSRGYHVAASDLSPGAVSRAQAELLCRGLVAPVTVADMRHRTAALATPADAILACDNAVPHLPTDDDILRAFRRWHDALRPGGVLVVSMRDYPAVSRRTPDVRPLGMRYDRGRRLVVVQVWEWRGEAHDIHLYLTEERPDGDCVTEVLHTRHYAVSIARLVELAHAAGFARAERRDGVLFQPIVVATRAR